MKTNYDSYKLGSYSTGYLMVHESGSGSKWYDGAVGTPWGYVDVYGEEGHASFRIIKDGRIYNRRDHGKTYTPRGLKIIATRFAREVFEG